MMSNSQLVANLGLLKKKLGAPKIAMDLNIGCTSTIHRWIRTGKIPLSREREVNTYILRKRKGRKS